MTLYTLCIYPSVHKQLIRTIFHTIYLNHLFNIFEWHTKKKVIRLLCRQCTRAHFYVIPRNIPYKKLGNSGNFCIKSAYIIYMYVYFIYWRLLFGIESIDSVATWGGIKKTMKQSNNTFSKNIVVNIFLLSNFWWNNYLTFFQHILFI